MVASLRKSPSQSSISHFLIQASDLGKDTIPDFLRSRSHWAFLVQYQPRFRSGIPFPYYAAVPKSQVLSQFYSQESDAKVSQPDGYDDIEWAMNFMVFFFFYISIVLLPYQSPPPSLFLVFVIIKFKSQLSLFFGRRIFSFLVFVYFFFQKLQTNKQNKTNPQHNDTSSIDFFQPFQTAHTYR